MAKPTLNEELVFSPELIKEVTGLEEVKSHDDFRNWAKELKEKPPEKVVETKDYEFKDDYIRDAVKYYGEKGDLSPYVTNSKDYSDTSTEELVRIQTKLENKGLSDKAINHLTKLEMAKYNLGEDASDDDKSLQEELLKVKTDGIRSTLTEAQKKFMAPEKPSVDIEKWASDVKGNDSTKGILENKNIVFEYEEKPFNLELDSPESLVDMTIDNRNFFKLFAKEDGSTDFNKWYKVMAYAKNMSAFESLLIKHGQSIGTESVVDNMQDAHLNRIPSGGASGDLLQAFADKGVHTSSR